GQDRPVARPEGERDHRQADPGGDRAEALPDDRDGAVRRRPARDVRARDAARGARGDRHGRQRRRPRRARDRLRRHAGLRRGEPARRGGGGRGDPGGRHSSRRGVRHGRRPGRPGLRPEDCRIVGRRVPAVKSVVVGLALAAAVVLMPQSPKAAVAAACGLPDTTPLWIDYTDGTLPFSTEIFAKPGVVAATGTLLLPPQLQKGGARTMFWEMHLV